MKNLSKIALWVMVAALILLPAWGLDTSKLKPTGYVNDFANEVCASESPRWKTPMGG